MCVACSQRVFLLERVLSDGHVYHARCFRCAHCEVQLVVGTQRLLCGKNYCSAHYNLIKQIGVDNYAELKAQRDSGGDGAVRRPASADSENIRRRLKQSSSTRKDESSGASSSRRRGSGEEEPRPSSSSKRRGSGELETRSPPSDELVVPKKSDKRSSERASDSALSTSPRKSESRKTPTSDAQDRKAAVSPLLIVPSSRQDKMDAEEARKQSSSSSSLADAASSSSERRVRPSSSGGDVRSRRSRREDSAAELSVQSPLGKRASDPEERARSVSPKPRSEGASPMSERRHRRNVSASQPVSGAAASEASDLYDQVRLRLRKTSKPAEVRSDYERAAAENAAREAEEEQLRRREEDERRDLVEAVRRQREEALARIQSPSPSPAPSVKPPKEKSKKSSSSSAPAAAAAAAAAEEPTPRRKKRDDDDFSLAEKLRERERREVNMLIAANSPGGPLSVLLEQSQPEAEEAELRQIERRQADLERRGVEMEKSLRAAMEQRADADAEERMLADWFALVAERNDLVRREEQLRLWQEDRALEAMAQGVNRAIHSIQWSNEQRVNDEQRKQEEWLLQELLEIIRKRDALVQQEDELVRKQAQSPGEKAAGKLQRAGSAPSVTSSNKAARNNQGGCVIC